MSEMTEQEYRIYPRKIFRCRARLSFDNKPPIDVWTGDISLSGISLMLTEAQDAGQYCVVKFDATVDGKLCPFSAIAKHIYSVCNSTGLYRAGFQFYELSTENAEIIEKLGNGEKVSNHGL